MKGKLNSWKVWFCATSCFQICILQISTPPNPLYDHILFVTQWWSRLRTVSLFFRVTTHISIQSFPFCIFFSQPLPNNQATSASSQISSRLHMNVALLRHSSMWEAFSFPLAASLGHFFQLSSLPTGGSRITCGGMSVGCRAEGWCMSDLICLRLHFYHTHVIIEASTNSVISFSLYSGKELAY